MNMKTIGRRCTLLLAVAATRAPRTVVLALAPVSLETTVKLRSNQKSDVASFLKRPSNWPNIVLSSFAVQGDAINRPLKKGSAVDEIFGLPPILPLKVQWICEKSTRSILDVRSASGVQGLATDCRMLFELSGDMDKDDFVNVKLTMEYQPVNFLGILAIPVLTIDNAIALRVLLPNALHKSINQSKSLDEFRRLMGGFYGIAGLAHTVDCLVGDSQLLVLAGCPGFYDLPTEGQILAAVWCAVGPLAFLGCLAGGRIADTALFLYGAVEVACAALVGNVYGGFDALPNAMVVQAVVAVSWVFSSLRKENDKVANVE